jgi:NAD(P)-dependent dehydrogenase (short-subunit alcohol dehydrogenase family)
VKELRGRVAVVTGGASGIGRALAEAFLGEGMKVVIADVEEKALAKAVAELSRGGGNVTGVATDVSKLESVQALADRVYALHGACHLLCNNAGVGAPGVNVWETTPNDWKWVYGVNVMGVVHGIQAFVPRMLAGGEEGHIVNTSSGDGGISPLPGQSVYASSKAAVSIITECLEAQLRAQGAKLSASILYPAGGLLATGIWSCDRNRPRELARERALTGPAQTLEWFQEAARKAGYELRVQPLDELAQHALDGIREGRFVIMIGLEDAATTLHQRADRIGKGQLPLDPHGGIAV